MASSSFENRRQPALPVRYSVIGANYRGVSIAQREQLAQFGEKQEALLARVRAECGFNEAALISTCNRFEIVSVASDGQGVQQPEHRVKEMIEASVGASFDVNQLYCLEDERAIRHVFRVAASLDSMIMGESQIGGQVKESYERAVRHGSAGKYLHQLFQFAFSLAKKVRSNTAIAEKGVSVSYVAVRLAEQIFGELKKAAVMIVGSGTMAELTGLHLKTRGCKNIIVANRSLERAFDLARRLEGSAIDLNDIVHHLETVDIVITSLANLDRPLIEAAAVRRLSRSKPLFFVDLGVPRNLSAAIDQVDNVYLYNIDDLSAIADDNRAIREEAAKEADLIIEHGLYRFERWLLKVSAEPSILDLRARIFTFCEEELLKALRGRLGADEEMEIRRIARRLSQRVSHDISRLLASLPGEKLSREEALRIIFEEYLKGI